MGRHLEPGKYKTAIGEDDRLGFGVLLQHHNHCLAVIAATTPDEREIGRNMDRHLDWALGLSLYVPSLQ